jgi:hypothetical protein
LFPDEGRWRIMSIPQYLDENSLSASSAAAAAAAARDRQKKSTMACEMCRKRKVTEYLNCDFNSRLNVYLVMLRRLLVIFVQSILFNVL